MCQTTDVAQMQDAPVTRVKTRGACDTRPVRKCCNLERVVSRRQYMIPPFYHRLQGTRSLTTEETMQNSKESAILVLTGVYVCVYIYIFIFIYCLFIYFFVSRDHVMTDADPALRGKKSVCWTTETLTCESTHEQFCRKMLKLRTNKAILNRHVLRVNLKRRVHVSAAEWLKLLFHTVKRQTEASQHKSKTQNTMKNSSGTPQIYYCLNSERHSITNTKIVSVISSLFALAAAVLVIQCTMTRLLESERLKLRVSGVSASLSLTLPTTETAVTPCVLPHIPKLQVTGLKPKATLATCCAASCITAKRFTFLFKHADALHLFSLVCH